ncbi:MAG: malto-oligosyltrehalose trehalohydrolase [Rhodothalassiaceae bacterium]
MSAHRMPFGADLMDDGVRFQLWAPSAQQVELVLNDRVHGTQTLEGGWREAIVSGAAAGDRYQYRINGELLVPDPASRAQVQDVHGPSLVVDPAAYAWEHTDWRGRPWHETVLYETHIGTFTADGSFDALRTKLDHLVDLGVTALELMPVADFSGQRSWGYDGVLPFAPDRAYGTPDDLKRLIDAAHGHGLMVFLDVVYNHFGPDGNYLHAYAESFFDAETHTPWGAAIDFTQRPVRDFFIANALYWLNEYRIDGLRLDAVHAIADVGASDTDEPFLPELARTVRAGVEPDRHIHLVLENDHNAAHLLRRTDGRPRHYEAQWNDDIHHVLHRMVTNETDGYYGDYAEQPGRLLARCLSEGFAYQGEPSAHRDGARRGEGSGDLPPDAFVAFLQNHDQVGNRAHGERITDGTAPEAVQAATALYLLSPQIPLIWMGEEWAATSPFPFFCDFHGDLAEAVREGRRREFARFKKFADPEARRSIPDPNATRTFALAKLTWQELMDPAHAERLAWFRQLLALRRAHVLPLVRSGTPETSAAWNGLAVSVAYHFPAGRLHLIANLGDGAAHLPAAKQEGQTLFATHPGLTPDHLPPYCFAAAVGEA